MATSSFRTTATVTAASVEKAPKKLWVNIGVELPSGEFVSLPLGVALDDPFQKQNMLRGDSVPAKMQASLLEALTQLTKGLQPGEGLMLPKLQCQLRHAAEKKEASTDVDAMAAMWEALGLTPPTPAAEPKPQDATSALMSALLGK